jgi:arylsulfatase A-like enzyme
VVRPDRAALSLRLLSFLIVGLLGCGRAATVPRAEDLLVRSALAGSPVLESRMGVNREVHCGSRTQYGIEMRDGARRSAIVLSGEKPRLGLSGCSPASTPGGSDPPGILTVVVESGRGEPQSVEVEIPAQEAWWHREIDLRELGRDLEGQVLHLRFRTQLPQGERLFLSEATLHHEVPAARPARRRPRQVLLVSLDTLRFDAVDTDPQGKTPTFARLARQAEQWNPHYAASSWTQPSHAALLTGYPLLVHATDEHAVHPAVTTLAERFRSAGFRTGGAVYDCVWLGKKFGFHRGFEDYQDGKWRLDTAVDHTLNWIGEHPGEDFFFFLHTYEPHSDFERIPYESSAFDEATVEELGFPDYGCRQGLCASRMLRGIREGQVQPLPGEGELLHRLYRAGVRDTDRSLGRLLEGLEALGVWRDLLLVVTSDHGEFFLEKGEVLHGSFWEPGVRVPLFIKWPAGRHAGKVRTAVSSALDLPPTLLQTFGLPADDLPGSALAKRRQLAEAGAAGPPAFIDAGGWHAVVTSGEERLKLIQHRFHGTLRLFDLQADPEESHNLLAERSQDVERLQALLARHDERSLQALEVAKERRERVENPAELDPEERERLRALGY